MVGGDQSSARLSGLDGAKYDRAHRRVKILLEECCPDGPPALEPVDTADGVNSLLSTFGETLSVEHELHNLGNDFYQLGKYEEAEQLAQDSLVLADELGATGTKSAAYEVQATIAFALCSHTKAQQLYERALDLATEAGNRWRSILALIGLGYTALALGDVQRFQPHPVGRRGHLGAV